MNLFLLFSILWATCDARRYENYTLFRGIPVENYQLEFLRNLSHYNANYWRMPGSLRMPVDFLIGPAFKDRFLEEAGKQGVYLTTINDDIQSAFDKQTIKSYTRKQMQTFGWQDFYRTKDIYDWMKDLSNHFPQEMQVFSIGKTHENRDMLAARVILKGSLLRSKVIIEGGIHAREWISPAFVTYMLHQIINSQNSNDSILKSLGKTYEWYFVPIMNPDGYEYAINTDRNWRKNRNGPGVDLNRNFGYAFGTEGVSFDQYADVYCGPKAFSEKETAAMGVFIRSKSANLEYYMSFHSYGQYIVIPYAHTTTHSENFDEVKQMGLTAADKIKSFYQVSYTVGTAYDTVGYKVSGASTCWAKKSFRVPYVVTFELRDQGHYGFALPTEQILPTCVETFAGVLSFLTPRSQKFSHLNYRPDALNSAGSIYSTMSFVQFWLIIMWFV